MIKLSDALKNIADLIADTGADGSEPDWIACHVLGCGRASLRLRREISDKEYGEMLGIAKERATGRPLCQITGYTEFLGLKIEVNGDVLCPRPETELLAEQAILYLKNKKCARALDLCTGSGCIAIALAKFTNAQITASDVSEKALNTARGNAANCGAEINFVLSDAFEKIEGEFDLIISNPPYIPTADIEDLEREVRDFEPRIALDGGEDGLDFYRIIADKAGDLIKDGGLLLLECGEGQAKDVADMLRGFSCSIIKDLQGIDRIVKAVKTGV